MKKLAMILVAAFLVLSVAVNAGEKVWPNGAPTVFVGFGAGGGTDTAVRPLVIKMQEYLGETINVVNMPGAVSAVAAEHVMGLPKDGYNMFATGSGCFGGFQINNTAPNGVPWAWTAYHSVQGPAAVIVNPAKSGIDSFDKLVERLRKGDVSIGVSGFGAGVHIIAASIAKAAGVDDVNYVTFDSCRATAVGVIAGEVEVGVISFSAGIDFAANGDMVALALNQTNSLKLNDQVTIPSITEVFPAGKDLPRLAETWPLMISRDAPQKVIDKLEEAFRWAIEQDAIKDFAEKNGMTVIGLSKEEADKFLDYQYCAYTWVIADADMGEEDPRKFDIPTAAEWDWDKRKHLYGY